jgi:hypothetical protein
MVANPRRAAVATLAIEIVYESCSTDVQPTSANEELEDLRIGLDKSNVARKHEFVKGLEKGQELAGHVEFLPIVVA